MNSVLPAEFGGDRLKIVTVLGGYGVFGSRIAKVLAGYPNVRVRVAGRTLRTGERFAHQIGAEFRACDWNDRDALRRTLDGSFLTIHTAGPFQGTDYRVAELCIEVGSHYLDIADGREFVTGIVALDATSSQRGLLVASGASTVPAVTDAMIRDMAPEFRSIDEIHIALSPGNQNPRGASTIAAILNYVGRPIRVWQDGRWTDRPGWGDVRQLEFPPPVGRRRVHNCDGPDLELFPATWHTRTVRFHAGVELNIINRTLSFIALVRPWLRMNNLPRFAPLFLWLSQRIARFGSKNGGLAVWLRGIGAGECPIERRLAIVTDTDGPAVPPAPAIALAKKLLDAGPPRTGAFPCVGLLSLAELMPELHPHRVWCVRGTGDGWQA
jgi:hypothetical protein